MSTTFDPTGGAPAVNSGLPQMKTHRADGFRARLAPIVTELHANQRVVLPHYFRKLEGAIHLHEGSEGDSSLPINESGFKERLVPLRSLGNREYPRAPTPFPFARFGFKKETQGKERKPQEETDLSSSESTSAENEPPAPSPLGKSRPATPFPFARLVIKKRGT